jgi:hypothetical protein
MQQLVGGVAAGGSNRPAISASKCSVSLATCSRRVTLAIPQDRFARTQPKEHKADCLQLTCDSARCLVDCCCACLGSTGCAVGHFLTACDSCKRIADCPVDCFVSGFMNSGQCTGELIAQSREVTTPPLNGCAACLPLTQSTNCNDCIVSAWNTDGACNTVTGKQTQTRLVVTTETNGGTCVSLTQNGDCNHCVVSDWDTSGPCDATTGTQVQTSRITTPTTNGGTCVDLMRDRLSSGLRARPVRRYRNMCAQHDHAHEAHHCFTKKRRRGVWQQY